jgi:hypothetical protein
MSSFRNGRAGWVAMIVLVAALAGVGGAFAAYPDSNVTHYAACLNTGGSAAGTFSQVAVGDSPAKTCGSNQTTVHLSGGDITKVTAGTGLTGGGDNGAVSLGLDPAYTLPQSCNPGEFPDWGGTSWKCFAAGIGLIVDSVGKTIGLAGSYQLPQGCSAGQIPDWGGQTWSCADQKSYSGSDFALSNQSCSSGQFVNGIDPGGHTQCGADQTYSGKDFALSSQDCTGGQFTNGVDGNGNLKCASPPSVAHDLYWNQNVIDQPCCDRLTDLVTQIDVPQGNYLINASIHVLNNDGDNQADTCYVQVQGGTKLGGPRQVYLAPQAAGGSQAWIPVAQPFTGFGVIDVYCNLFHADAFAEITATQVGTIQGSGVG